MTDSLSLIRTLIREELQSLRMPDIGVVTSVFPHKEGDKNNYECNVKLREGTLELRQVPIATPHIGMASVPNVGDLVLLNYVHGDPNRAIVVGRLYSDKANPPEHEDKEWKVVSPLKDGVTSYAIDKDESIVISAGKTVVTIKKDGDIEIKGETQLSAEIKGNVELKTEGDVSAEIKGKLSLKGEADMVIETTGNVSLKCKDCKIDASGNIDLGDGGSGVITEKSHKCYFTGKALKASKKVKAF